MSATPLGPVTELAYRAQQFSMLVPATIVQEIVRRLGKAKRPKPPPGAQEALRRELEALFERDLENVARGHYPSRLLFSIPVRTYARAFPYLLADMPRSILRRGRGRYRDLPDEVDLSAYPPYFRRTFHWQTDGYLSQRSAKLYDVGVEFLFAGTADVMRRRVVAPVVEHLGHEGARGKRLLDVACGTGRTLAMLHEALPGLRLYGLDLSPYYIKEARERLSEVTDLSLVAENAEAMPFADGLFDVVTSVYLFHELPKNARRRVFAEMFRVLAPGGRLIIEDSAQLAECGELSFFLEQFPVDFHEPFYRDYLKDDLAPALEEAGFVVERVERCFVAKVVVAHKP